MVCLPIFFGAHKKTYELGNKLQYCHTCHRQSSQRYFVRKFVGHFFFIPLIALGTYTYVECANCKATFKLGDKPTDFAFIPFFIIGILMIGAIFFVLLEFGDPTYTILLIVLTAVIATSYLFITPSSQQGQSSLGHTSPPSGIASTTMVEQPRIQVTETQMPHASYTYQQHGHMPRALYSKPNLQPICPHCHTPSNQSKPGTIITCFNCFRDFIA